jgi:hypothetical protein
MEEDAAGRGCRWRLSPLAIPWQRMPLAEAVGGGCRRRPFPRGCHRQRLSLEGIAVGYSLAEDAAGRGYRSRLSP